MAKLLAIQPGNAPAPALSLGRRPPSPSPLPLLDPEALPYRADRQSPHLYLSHHVDEDQVAHHRHLVSWEHGGGTLQWSWCPTCGGEYFSWRAF